MYIENLFIVQKLCELIFMYETQMVYIYSEMGEVVSGIDSWNGPLEWNVSRKILPEINSGKNYLGAEPLEWPFNLNQDSDFDLDLDMNFEGEADVNIRVLKWSITLMCIFQVGSLSVT